MSRSPPYNLSFWPKTAALETIDSGRHLWTGCFHAVTPPVAQLISDFLVVLAVAQKTVKWGVKIVTLTGGCAVFGWKLPPLCFVFMCWKPVSPTVCCIKMQNKHVSIWSFAKLFEFPPWKTRHFEKILWSAKNFIDWWWLVYHLHQDTAVWLKPHRRGSAGFQATQLSVNNSDTWNFFGGEWCTQWIVSAKVGGRKWTMDDLGRGGSLEYFCWSAISPSKDFLFASKLCTVRIATFCDNCFSFLHIQEPSAATRARPSRWLRPDPHWMQRATRP